MNLGTPEQASAVRHAIEAGGRKHIETVQQAIESTGAIAYTARLAEAEAERAIAALDAVPPSQYREALLALAEFSVNRSY